VGRDCYAPWHREPDAGGGQPVDVQRRPRRAVARNRGDDAIDADAPNALVERVGDVQAAIRRQSYIGGVIEPRADGRAAVAVETPAAFGGATGDTRRSELGSAPDGVGHLVGVVDAAVRRDRKSAQVLASADVLDDCAKCTGAAPPAVALVEHLAVCF